eukprot:scaffold16678_cov17-Tisochrysis_lutea.AAC.1
MPGAGQFMSILDRISMKLWSKIGSGGWQDNCRLNRLAKPWWAGAWPVWFFCSICLNFTAYASDLGCLGCRTLMKLPWLCPVLSTQTDPVPPL